MFVSIAVIAFATILGARWLFSGASDGPQGPRSASAAEPIATEPANHTRRTALDEAIANAGVTAPEVAPETKQNTTLESTPNTTPNTTAGTTAGTTAETTPASTPKSAASATAEPAAAPATAPSPSTAPAPTAQPPAPTPDQAPSDSSTTKQDPSKAPASTTSPDAEPRTPREKEPFFGNGFNASNPPSAPAPAGAETAGPPADSPAGKLRDGLALAASEPVKARALLSAAMLSGTLAEPEARSASNALSHISAQLFLTPVFNASDTSCFQYTVQPNDSLEKIVRKNKIGCDWRLVARLNNIKKPESIQVGKRLKLPKGPFSAVVSKRDYRIDICVGEGSDRVIVASMPVGLGEANGTPVGMFKVKSGSKLLNPEWVHPVTGKRYEASDAENPIGEHWLGLEGTEDKTSKLKGYGIHGTVEPDSIGQNRSLGCVRLLADDVAVVWECLGDGAIVEIRAN